jgi:hypothetical protein
MAFQKALQLADEIFPFDFRQFGSCTRRRPDRQEVRQGILHRIVTGTGDIGKVHLLERDIAPACFAEDTPHTVRVRESEWPGRGRVGGRQRASRYEGSNAFRPWIVLQIAKAREYQARRRGRAGRQVSEGGERVGKEHHSVPGHHQVGCETFTAPASSVGEFEGHIGQVSPSFARSGEQIAADVHADHLCRGVATRQGKRQLARAAADIERALDRPGAGGAQQPVGQT